MNLSTKVISKDFYISAVTIVKVNLNDKTLHQTKALTENWNTFKFFQTLHIKPNLKDTKVI